MIDALIRTLAPTLAAGALAYLVYLLVRQVIAIRTGPSRALTDYMASPESRSQAAQMGSDKYCIGLAFSAYGFDVSGREETARNLAYGLATLVLLIPLWLFQLPAALWLAPPLIAYVLVNMLIDNQWQAVRVALEKELPTFMMRLSSHVQASPNLIAAIDRVAEGLDPEKPLQDWMKRLAGALQARGRTGLERMQAEAAQISPSLALVVVEIGRMWATGGAGYGQALKLAAGNLANLLETRAQAHAVGAGAWGTARTILIALSITLGGVLTNPVSRPAMSAPLVQIALLLMLAWGAFGFWRIRDMINAVVE